MNDVAGEYPGSTHVRDVGLRGAEDQQIWDYARTHDFVIVSKDTDFRERSYVEGFPPKIVWLDVGNAGTAAIAALLRRERERVERFEMQEETSLLILSIVAGAVGMDVPVNHRGHRQVVFPAVDGVRPAPVLVFGDDERPITDATEPSMYASSPDCTPIDASSTSLAVPPHTDPGSFTTVVTLPSVVMVPTQVVSSWITLSGAPHPAARSDRIRTALAPTLITDSYSNGSTSTRRRGFPPRPHSGHNPVSVNRDG